MKLNHIAFYTKRFVHNAQTAIDEATMQWKQRKISNFHYLMLINKYAGRSYLDPANYPVFPWIIASYDFKQYLHRDLTKTIGALVLLLIYRALNKESDSSNLNCRSLILLILYHPISLAHTIALQESFSIF